MSDDMNIDMEQYKRMKFDLEKALRRADEEKKRADAFEQDLKELRVDMRKKKLRQLAAKSISIADASISKNHQTAQVTPFDIRDIKRPDSVPWVEVVSRTWDSKMGNFNNPNEATLATHVLDVLVDILASMKLSEVCPHLETTAIKLRPDIWIIYRKNIPIGIVEVKRSDNENTLRNDKVMGQMYDYMKLLLSFVKTTLVFGIVTTYTAWRFCKYSSEASATERILSATDVYKWNDDNIVDYIADTLYAMYANNRNPSLYEPFRHLNHRVLIYYNDASFFLGKLNQDAVNKAETNPDFFVSKESWFAQRFPGEREHLYLLKDLVGGADGRVFLACSNALAHICVIKFATRTNIEQSDEDLDGLLTLEQRNWALVYGTTFPSRLQRLNGKLALVMTWFDLPDDTRIRDKTFQTDLARLLRVSFADKNLYHADIAWRNIGCYLDQNGQCKPVVFDLRTVKDYSFADDAARQAFVDATMENLLQEIQTIDAANSNSNKGSA
jgi:hypothetical protein